VGKVVNCEKRDG